MRTSEAFVGYRPCGYSPWIFARRQISLPWMKKAPIAWIKKRFGQAVRAIRLKQGISQEELAEMADVDRTYMSEIERGLVSVGLEKAQQLADALKVPLSKVIREAEKMQAK